MKLTAGGATDRGPRLVNQDAFFIDVDLGLVVVADGMGGHNAGEVASQLAVKAVVDFVRTTHTRCDITWPFPFDPQRSLTVNRLDAALRLANRTVYDAGEQNQSQAGMGTTIVAVLVQGSQIVVAHVGDSRAYVLRHGELVQVTEDHTLLNAMGATSASPDHPMRHVLTQGIGMGPDLIPSLAESPLTIGERWLICTDGVHGYLDVEGLRGVMNMSAPAAAASEAVARALRAGTTDNATAVVLNVD